MYLLKHGLDHVICLNSIMTTIMIIMIIIITLKTTTTTLTTLTTVTIFESTTRRRIQCGFDRSNIILF